jgi:hypothetical protein
MFLFCKRRDEKVVTLLETLGFDKTKAKKLLFSVCFVNLELYKFCEKCAIVCRLTEM